MKRMSGTSLQLRETNFLSVLVLYGLAICDSPAYRTFCVAARHCGSDPNLLTVYDNSPIRQVTPEQEQSLYAFHHDPANRGLAAAYNWALSLANDRGMEWLLLLDQDSELPPHFLQEMRRAVLSHGADSQIAALVPHVRGATRPVSPCRVGFAHLMPIAATFSGVIRSPITAINSGALVRTEFIRSLGGFNENFPLDCLDHWLFHEIHAAGKAIAVVPVTLRHDLSVHNYREKVSAARYHSILTSEARFVASYKSRPERLVYPLRLLARGAKQAVIFGHFQNAAVTLGMIPRILISSGSSAPKRAGTVSRQSISQ